MTSFWMTFVDYQSIFREKGVQIWKHVNLTIFEIQNSYVLLEIFNRDPKQHSFEKLHVLSYRFRTSFGVGPCKSGLRCEVHVPRFIKIGALFIFFYFPEQRN